MASVPRTLTELLIGFIDDVVNQIEVVYLNLDTFISKDHWTKQFQCYLRKRGLGEEEQILKFLLLTEIVLKYENLITSASNPKQKEKLKREQRKVFDHIVITFFSEESEDQIALSNQKLFDILSTYAESVGNDKPVSEEMLNHLKKAKTDSKVWANGLDPIYMNFLNQTNTSKSVIACILSIL